jgi:CopG-like RHH_1 or ribbon-helix-helix domain, RHH_5
MRTTVTLPDALLEQAKREADRQGSTLSGLIERALRAMLLRRAPESERTPFKLIAFGEGGLRAGISFDRLKEVLEEEELERVRPGLNSRAADGDDAAPRR